MAPNSHYHSFLLRLWRDNADRPWRASLQSTATSEMQTFADPLMLIAFLIEELTLDEKSGEVARFAAWLNAQRAAD